MFQGKSVITALLALATTILLSAGQAQAQGCGSRQSATVRGTGQQSTLLSALRQQQQNALLVAALQQLQQQQAQQPQLRAAGNGK